MHGLGSIDRHACIEADFILQTFHLDSIALDLGVNILLESLVILFNIPFHFSVLRLSHLTDHLFNLLLQQSIIEGWSYRLQFLLS
jgi:hypothetical protein